MGSPGLSLGTVPDLQGEVIMLAANPNPHKAAMSDPPDSQRWLKVAANLRVDRKHTIAPHKPLLLLVVADLAEEGTLTSAVLSLTGELVFRFLAFWTVVAKSRPQR